MMEIVNGEQVATNKKTGEQVVLRGGKWVPYNAAPSAYQKYFAQPATAGVEKGLGALAGPLGILASKIAPGAAEAISKTIVPQTPKQAGIDAGMLAGGALAPEAVIPGIIARMGASAAGGAIGSKLGGDTAMSGAKEGAIQQGVGEVAAPALSLLGRYGKTLRNQKDVERIGGFLSNVLPSIGGLRSVDKFDSAFRGGEATEKVGQKLAKYEGAISKRLGDTEIGTMDIATRGSPQSAPTTVRVKATFDDMVQRIRDLNRTGYAYSGDAQQKALAADARREAHDLTQDLGKALNKQAPGLGDRFLRARRQYSTASLMTRIFSDPSLYDASGRMDMNSLQELVANRGSAGFREDLTRVLGRDKTNDFLKKVYRNAPPTARDVSGGLNLGARLHPASPIPTLVAHPHLSATVGQLPRRFPQIPPTAAALLLGQLPGKVAGQSQ